MLHAILHRKLDPLTPDAQRLEDAVTSTVFGTVTLVERWDLLLRWLGAPCDEAGEEMAGEVWYWPTLRTPGCIVIPDVVVRIGRKLFVVEAKYGSGRNDIVGDAENPEQVRDQLARQYKCLCTPADQRRPYPDGIETALTQCAVQQIFLVDARRIKSARRELMESQACEPRMNVRLVTWQQLDRLLHESHVSKRWVADLRRFMELEGLSAFVGFGDFLAAHGSRQGILGSWRRAAGTATGLRNTANPALRSRIELATKWKPTAATRAEARGWLCLDSKNVARFRPVTLWRQHTGM
jgi:hypothetical protein